MATGPKDSGSAQTEQADFRNEDVPQLLDAVAGYALLLSADGRILFFNRSPPHQRLENAVGTQVGALVDKSQRAMVNRCIRSVLEDGAPAEMDVKMAQTGVWYQMRIARLQRSVSGSELLVHLLDIDEHKRLEKSYAMLRASIAKRGGGSQTPAFLDRRLDAMADALPVLISYVDSSHRYQYNNAMYERWFAGSREDIRGRSLEEVLGPEAYGQIRGNVEAALGGQSVTFELTIPYKDAGLRTVIADYVPDFTAEGDVAGFYALVRDVSEARETQLQLKRREEEARQLQKLEALGRLAGGIAHDFNNLLQSMINGCAVVLQMVGEDSPAAAKIGQIKRGALRGASLTRQLLAFSRQSEEHEPGPLDVDELLGDLEVLLVRLLPSNVALNFDFDAEAEVIADAGQIQQIVMNLVINARDAMPAGGEIRLQTSTAMISGHTSLAEGRYVVISVTDEGTGMDEETRARIFEPFFTTKPPGEGTGLGLSTTYGIMRQLGGAIEVDSEPGQGSTFRLFLPQSQLPTFDG